MLHIIDNLPLKYRWSWPNKMFNLISRNLQWHFYFRLPKSTQWCKYCEVFVLTTGGPPCGKVNWSDLCLVESFFPVLGMRVNHSRSLKQIARTVTEQNAEDNQTLYFCNLSDRCLILIICVTIQAELLSETPPPPQFFNCNFWNWMTRTSSTYYC